VLGGGPAAAQGADAPVTAIERPLDLRGLHRDTAYFFGYQALAVVLISQRPKSETNFGEMEGLDRWWENVTNPVWDKDSHFINYVMHPYWGAGYYVRGRERGLDRPRAFWYSVLLSSIFEFGAEAMVEPVSYQDLVVTPVVGSLLGEYVFWPLRERILSSGMPLSTSDRVLLALTDPLGALNEGVNRLFGVQTELTVVPMAPGATRHHLGPHAGLSAAPVARRPRDAGWGVQLRVQW
jgi:Domain of unknown function (DUF3943)